MLELIVQTAWIDTRNLIAIIVVSAAACPAPLCFSGQVASFSFNLPVSSLIWPTLSLPGYSPPHFFSYGNVSSMLFCSFRLLYQMCILLMQENSPQIFFSLPFELQIVNFIECWNTWKNKQNIWYSYSKRPFSISHFSTSSLNCLHIYILYV